MIRKTSPDEIQNYLSDAANIKGHCDAVCLPESAEEISRILSEAYQSDTPVTIAGNGTGLTGARVPMGGIVVSTEKLNRILEINKEEKYILAEPAVLLNDLQEEVESRGLFYPPDPTERGCFIGATAATNSSGARTFKYGPTRNFVQEIEVVLPDGELCLIKRGEVKAEGYDLTLRTLSGKTIDIKLPDYKMPATKNAAGYYCHPDMDAIDLFIGSEGTLGVITRLKLKLLDLPENVLSSVIFFDEEEGALEFIGRARELSYQARQSGADDAIDARGLEYFDSKSLRFLQEEFPQIPQKAQAAVWFEQNITADTEETLFEKWFELITETGGDEESAWFASNSSDRERFKNFRHAVSAKVNEYISNNNITKVGTDIAVPDVRMKEFYYFLKETAEASGINYLIYGHFGNSHYHMNMLPKDQEEHGRAKEMYLNICRKAVGMSGTISAEHGIGKLKRQYLLEMYGEDIIKKMAALKLSLDPKGLLCRGNIFDEKYLG
ncbi:MAG: FAD-binding oxidoreductase [Bacteroidota bacterium]